MINNKKILETYNQHARTYDRDNFMMERLISKGRKIFCLLKGKILEIGIGTGNNLFHYDPSTQVLALDFSPQMIKFAKQKVERFELKHVKKFITGDIQKLSNYFKTSTFDYVTSTCVFCSVPNPIKGLQEVKKILRTNGKLIQIEHGLSNFRFINVILKLLDPITVKNRGFHLSRNIIRNLQIAGFDIIHYWPLDPFGIFKVVISEPSKLS